MPSEKIVSNIMVKTSYISGDDYNDVRFALNQHASVGLLYCYLTETTTHG